VEITKLRYYDELDNVPRCKSNWKCVVVHQNKA